MKRDIFIIRHGNAYFNNFGMIDDIDRNLDVEGIKEAIDMGECLKDKEISFDKIYSSSASRALQTAVIVARTLHVDMKKVEIKSELYLASVKSIIDTIRNSKNSNKSIAIFAHNPGVSDLAWKTNQHINVSTCGVLHYEIEIDNLSDFNLEALKFISYGCPEVY